MLHQARFAFAGLLVLSSAAWAQSVISAHSGTIHYVEGRVLLNGKEIDPKIGEFPNMQNGQELRTAEGRAEVLLTPGAFLRVGEDSALRMASNRLSDTRLELAAGKAVLEVVELLPGNSVSVVVNGHSVSLLKTGVVELTATPPAIRVYQGEAIVASDGSRTTVKRGKQATLEAVVTTAKLEEKDTDDLYRWSARRSGYIAMANTSAASYAGSSSYSGYPGYSGFGYGMGPGFGFGYGALGSWAYNPWFGMYTYMPFGDMLFNPFGYAFYSPYGFYNAYGAYGPYLNGTGGGSTGSRVSSRGNPATPSPYRGAHSVGTALVSRSGSVGASRGSTSSYSGYSGGGYRGGGATAIAPSASMPAGGGIAGGGMAGGGMRGGGGGGGGRGR